MKSKTLVILVFVLLLSNIVLLYFYFNKCKKGNRGSMVERVANDIGFNASQKATFLQQKETLNEKIKPLKDSLMQIKNELVTQQMQQLNDSTLQLNINKMGAFMLQIEKLNFASIQESKKICTPQQLPIYDSIVKKMMLRMPNKGKK
jgi:periplasmic protein CpxP/Spy